MDVNNLFANISHAGPGEEFLTLFENIHAKIERIVSHAHVSPADFWYDQEGDEWVIVMRGTATVEFFDGAQVKLHEGDYLTIPRHVKHRVAQTSEETIWLAVHLIK